MLKITITQKNNYTKSYTSISHEVDFTFTVNLL